MLACLHIKQNHGLVTSTSLIVVLADSQWNHQVQLSHNTPSFTFFRQEPHLPDNSLDLFLSAMSQNLLKLQQVKIKENVDDNG
jgi:hypothetical protein